MTHTIDTLMALADKTIGHSITTAVLYVNGELDDSDEFALKAKQAHDALREALTKAQDTLDFYKRRVVLLQEWQSKMRDPERTMACDIIANGQMMPEFGRYEIKAAQPVREPLTDEWLNALADRCTPNTETGSLNYRKFARAIEKAHGIGGGDE